MKIRTNGFEGPPPVASAGKTAANADEEDKDKGRPLTSKIAEVITAIKGWSLPDGYSFLGTQALHLRALVGLLDAWPIQGRLDSGADIMLMSEDYCKELTDAPAIKEGIRMKLYHLTGHAKVLGYIKIPMYAAATNGKFISFELEAYIVRDMRVPLLLGEDFQTTYELGVTRFSSEGSLQAQDLVNGIARDPLSEEDRLLNDENWGPKTTATLEELLEGDMEDLVTLGPDIPDNVRPCLVEVLCQNSAAFGTGGRLGQVAAKVSIPLQPGVQPISVPMYGASPAKREVIDKQVHL
ncbi:hypothetical protein DXG01_015524 [Tephrocybe rancida]|nr:hypothetical protein DXG01_015524 [Tephrocybe rancida]